MAKHSVPNEWERRILEENGINPEGVNVCASSDDYIRTQNYNTRDVIVIHKGDRPWPAREVTADA